MNCSVSPSVRATSRLKYWLKVKNRASEGMATHSPQKVHSSFWRMPEASRAAREADSP